MNEDLKNVGLECRAKRFERNISTKEVENCTSIRSAFIEAIEEGKLKSELANIYAIGFMRQYIDFLGMDSEQIENKYPQAFEALEVSHQFHYGIGTLEMRTKTLKGKWRRGSIIWLIWGLGAFLLLLYFFKKVGII